MSPVSENLDAEQARCKPEHRETTERLSRTRPRGRSGNEGEDHRPAGAARRGLGIGAERGSSGKLIGKITGHVLEVVAKRSGRGLDLTLPRALAISAHIPSFDSTSGPVSIVQL